MPPPRRPSSRLDPKTARTSGLRLALLSLTPARAERVVVYRPEDTAFGDWLRAPPASAGLREPRGAESWNCKPHVLCCCSRRRRRRARRASRGSRLRRHRHARPDAVVVPAWTTCSPPPRSTAAATHQGSRLRTEGWALPWGTFERTINTAVLGATRRAIRASSSDGALERPDFIARVQRFADVRPPGARLRRSRRSRAPRLRGVRGPSSVKLFETGKEIIHCGGVRTYSLKERLDLLFQPSPTFLHSNGMKPWIVFHPENQENVRGADWLLRKWLVETSYVTEARTHRDEMGIPTPVARRAHADRIGVAPDRLRHHYLAGLDRCPSLAPRSAKRRLWRRARA